MSPQRRRSGNVPADRRPAGTSLDVHADLDPDGNADVSGIEEVPAGDEDVRASGKDVRASDEDVPADAEDVSASGEDVRGCVGDGSSRAAGGGDVLG
ncbi:hypothetical protein, partial [Actinomadura soli]|uniref:hypothetical protein n=1 Tax=Actinomadura soli TaxID=2508997 RepID=UPI00197A748A